MADIVTERGEEVGIFHLLFVRVLVLVLTKFLVELEVTGLEDLGRGGEQGGERWKRVRLNRKTPTHLVRQGAWGLENVLVEHAARSP